MPQAQLPPWIVPLQQRDPQFADSYMVQRERILSDGVIPAKDKILVTMALQSHLDGVATIANRARAARSRSEPPDSTGTSG